LASQSHFAVGHFLGLVVFRKRIWTEYDQRNNPSSRRLLAFLQSLSRSNLVARHSLKRITQHLSWTFGPYSTFQRRGSTLTQAVPWSCFGPPSGFGYPLDGFRPSTPGRACFVPTALLGFHLFGVFPSQKVIDAFPRPSHPHDVSPTRSPVVNRRTGVGGLDFRVLTLPRVPGCQRGFSP
jgi:hypothetical protein